MRAVEVLYGASVLPTLKAPQSLLAKPMKLLREVSPPLTTELLFELVLTVPELR